MPYRIFHLGLLPVLCFVLLTASCGNKPKSASSILPSSPRTSSSANLASDYTKPYLTDEKMTKFLESMKEEHNPLEIIFKQGGQMRNPLDVASRLREFNAFAQKYGFQDYQDYTAVWGRILAGETQLWAAEMQAGMATTLQKSIEDAKQQLKQPNLNPEMRKVYEEQIASTQKSLDDMKNQQSGSTLNDSDMALIKKYKDQIEAAEKKYQSPK